MATLGSSLLTVDQFDSDGVERGSWWLGLTHQIALVRLTSLPVATYIRDLFEY